MIDLIESYLSAKRQEDEAKAKRVGLQNQLADALGRPEEGQKTHTVEDYKITVKSVINRTVDWESFDAAMVGCNIPPPTIIKRSLDIKGLRWFADNDPNRYFEIQKSITEKPGLVGITIKTK